jgi:hypothetical protein
LTKTQRAPVRPRLGAAAAWALAAALLFAQCLGLAHGVLHAGHDVHGEHGFEGAAVHGDADHRQAADRHAAECDHTHAHGHAQSLAGLFGHTDDDGAACRLLDHASVADLLVAGLAPEPTLVTAPVPLPAPQFGGVSAYAGSYLARAPPKAA